MSGEGIPKLYRSIEETPEFQAEAAARREADRMISEACEYICQHGGWFGGDFYLPGGILVKDAKLPSPKPGSLPASE